MEKEKSVEEIVVIQQPTEKVMPPTAQIETEEHPQPEEAISTTTSVEQSFSPTFQATSSVKHPEQTTETTEEIIVQTEVRHSSVKEPSFHRRLAFRCLHLRNN